MTSSCCFVLAGVVAAIAAAVPCGNRGDSSGLAGLPK
jgi:hypothetical protein